MNQHLLGIAAVLLLGIGGQWLAWRLHLPGILVLLALGLFVPPFLPAIDPVTLLGDLFMPIVSVSIGLILFEGALELKWREIQETRRAFGKLISLGALVNWLVITCAAYLLLGFTPGTSLLMGAVLVVTGPTVIGPLLRHIRARGPSATMLKWEGIVIDPLGASLALIVFEALMAASRHDAALGIAWSIAATLLAAMGVAGAACWVLWSALRRHMIPDHLQIPVTLAIVVMALVGANALQHESGLLAVTIMGAFFANQRSVAIGHIVEFKENIRVVLIACLFILLTARVPVSSLWELGWPVIGFVAVILLVARPLAILASTAGSRLDWKERCFLMCLAPRGIVAASVASVFAFSLTDVGHVDAAAFTPTAFAVIIGTVVFYSVLAPLAARRMGISEADPQGFLIIGAEPWCCQLAQILQSRGIRVLMVDTNRDKLTPARMNGIETWHGNALSEEALETLDLGGIGHCVSATPNAEVNLLAARHFSGVFGRKNVFRVAPEDEAHKGEGAAAGATTGRILFADDMTGSYIAARLQSGDTLRVTTITAEYTLKELQEQQRGTARILLVIGTNNRVRVSTSDAPQSPEPSDTVLTISS